MSGKLADITARIETVHKLDAVIRAMRGIAAARVQEAHRHLSSVRSYAATIGAGISDMLASAPVPANLPSAPDRQALIIFAADQGFAGTYTDRLFDAAAQDMNSATDLFIVGTRGLGEAEERGWQTFWSAPMITEPAQAPNLAGQIAEAVFAHLADSGAARLSVIHAVPGQQHQRETLTKQLVPFDFARFPPSARLTPPDTNLTAEALLRDLVQEYIFAELTEAALLAFAAENEARMRAMIAAQDNTAQTLTTLTAQSRQLRQEEITEEITELAVSALSQSPA